VARAWLAAGLVVVASAVPAGAQMRSTRVHLCPPTATVCNTSVPGPSGKVGSGRTSSQKREAAAISVVEANAMQAAAVAHGQANSVLANPYIEEKVTTPESVGVNRTKIPAGGF
jgi:hypothetical protein